MATKTKRSPAGAFTTLARDLTRRGAWGDETDARFQEYVAREHLDGGMPVVELHRNHGLPLSAVRRWIATYGDGGRAGLEAQAAAARDRAAARDVKNSKKGATAAEVAKLEAMVASSDIEVRRAAYAIIQKRKLVALVPAVLASLSRLNATRRSLSVEAELDVLAGLKAKHALHELRLSKLRILNGYEPSWSGFLRAAGCRIKTVQRPWSQSYELDGKWHRLP